MINAPKFFKDLTVVSRMEIAGKITEVTTTSKGCLIHWKPQGNGWMIKYRQLPFGELIYP